MPLLTLIFITSWSGNKNKIFILTIAALALSWTGDLFLQFQGINDSFFIFGLGSFLLAHVAYITTYYHAQSDMGIKPNNTFYVVRVVVLAMIGGALLNILWSHLGELRIPVTLYTCVIILMAIFAVLRKDRTSPNSFSLIYGGALLFIISDGMIAISKFIEPFDYYRLYIMLTYILAQFLIVRGILSHQKMEE